MLSIDADIPVSVEPANGVDQGAALRFLRSLNLLALGTRSDGGDPQSTESGHDIARLEAKIDLLVAMVGALVAEHVALPPRQTLSLSAESVHLNFAHDNPEVGAEVVVALYLSNELPRALRLPARVASLRPAPDGGTDSVLELGPLEPAVRDEIERYIFLRHRHSLSRQAAS